MPDRRKILIIDDDRDARTAFATLLGFEGYEVFEAGDGREALTRLRALEATPDVILLDLIMPVMDGKAFRAAQLADERLAPIPVVLFSAATPLAGADAGLVVLPKPPDFARLLEVLADLTRPR